MNYQELGLTLLRYRKLKNLDQKQLAELSGVSRNYISIIERGRAKNISVDVLVRLAEGLGIEVWILLGALIGGREG